jgi:hypothetical protein
MVVSFGKYTIRINYFFFFEKKYNLIINFFFIGLIYDQSENDILLLDISNNDEYIWTNDFDPSPTSQIPSAILPSRATKATKATTILYIIGTVISLFIGCFSLKFVYFNWNKNKKNWKMQPQLLEKQKETIIMQIW